MNRLLETKKYEEGKMEDCKRVYASFSKCVFLLVTFSLNNWRLTPDPAHSSPNIHPLKLKLQYFGHLMQRADSLEKTLMLGKIEGRRRRGCQRMR